VHQNDGVLDEEELKEGPRGGRKEEKDETER
jgi:hypothetical protein